MTEQEQHLASLLNQRKELSDQFDTLESDKESTKNLLLKVQGAIEYLNQIGVTLPEPEVTEEAQEEPEVTEEAQEEAEITEEPSEEG